MVASLYVSFPGSGLFQETCKVGGELGYIYFLFSPTLGESTEKTEELWWAIVLRAAKKPLSRRQGLWALRISVTFSWARRYRPCRDKAQSKGKAPVSTEREHEQGGKSLIPLLFSSLLPSHMSPHFLPSQLPQRVLYFRCSPHFCISGIFHADSKNQTPRALEAVI